MGWVSELQENSSLIHVRYDLDNLQQGCIFKIPSGIDTGEWRIFRVVKITNSIVYPASVVCEIVPEYYDTYDEGLSDHRNYEFTLLNEEEDDL